MLFLSEFEPFASTRRRNFRLKAPAVKGERRTLSLFLINERRNMKKRIFATVALLVATVIVPAPAQALIVCPSGSAISASNNQLCAPTPLTASPLTFSTTKNCPTGFILNFQETACTAIKTTYTATADITYTCLSSSDLLDANHICTTPSGTTTYQATGTLVYSCPSGGSLSGTTCTLTTTYSPITVSTCPSGYTKTTVCTKTTTVSASGFYVGSYLYYTCPSGYTSSGSGSSMTCWTTDTQLLGSSSTCNSGDSFNAFGTACVHNSSYSATSSTNYSCPSGGSLSNTTCTKAITGTTYSATYTANYSCNLGDSLAGSICTITQTTQSFTLLYAGTCPTHYALNSATGICNAQAFSPSSNLVQTTFLCVTQNSDGSQTSSAFTFDATFYSSSGAYRTCQSTTATFSANSGAYICETQSPNANGYMTSFSFTSNNDVTSSDSNGSVTSCFYTGDSVTIDDGSLESFIFTQSDATSCDAGNLTFDEYLACEML